MSRITKLKKIKDDNSFISARARAKLIRSKEFFKALLTVLKEKNPELDLPNI